MSPGGWRITHLVTHNKCSYSDLSNIGSQEQNRINREKVLHQWYHWVTSLIQHSLNIPQNFKYR